MQYGYNTGDLSEDELSDLPSCAFASRSINSNLQHHYLTSLHHTQGELDLTNCQSFGSIFDQTLQKQILAVHQIQIYLHRTFTVLRPTGSRDMLQTLGKGNAC